SFPIYEIEPEQQQVLEEILKSNGIIITPEGIEPLVRYSMACPALPTCGLAITESERALPSIIERIRVLLDKLGLQQEHFVIRMTGCPNGCARPYMAELGFVGSAPEKYQVWLGGSPNQTRLARVYENKMPIQELESFLEPIFVYFKTERQAKESFGDFCDRIGFDAIRDHCHSNQPTPMSTNSENGLVNEAVAAEPVKKTVSTQNRRHRIRVRDELHQRIKEAAAKQGKTMTDLAAEALEAYLEKIS
ncbi:MAG: sulfite reductase, ferredoxin dependent, partial [Merismopedia sp. SIO2A8]|nr:sulfite reductase, ferredoxin dependent [Merismopedia sp. SIO2A8]